MHRWAFYLSVALLAFGICSLIVFGFYLQTNKTEILPVDYQDAVNQQIAKAESANIGFEEISKAKDGEIVTVQGSIDEKFLCPDVRDSQRNICTTALIGNSLEHKALVVRLKICNEQIKSNCIYPNKNIICDKDSKPEDITSSIPLEENFNGRKSTVYVPKPYQIQIKVRSKVSKIDDKYYLKETVDSVEIIKYTNR